MIPGFEWNEEKAQSNLKKHGVSFAEAATVFDDPYSLIMDDPKHSIGEARFIFNSNLSDDDMLDEYDFSQAVRRNSRQSLEGKTIRIETENGERSVQIRTIETSACINDEGRVTLQLPPDLAPGEYQVTLLIQVPAIEQAA